MVDVPWALPRGGAGPTDSAAIRPRHTTQITGSPSGKPLSTDVDLEPLDEDLREARRYLPLGDAAARDAFAAASFGRCRRLTQLLAFYRANPCRMSRTQLLAACAITLGRFCGYSRLSTPSARP